MKKNLLSITFLFLVNFVLAQETDSTRVKKTTKTKTTTTTTVTTVISEPIDSVKQAKANKKIKDVKDRNDTKQELSDKKNIIKTNITAFLLSTIHLNYERVINKNITVQLGAHYTFFGDDNNNSGNDFARIRGFGITPEVRLYPLGLAPTGFFVGLSPRFQTYTVGSVFNNSQRTITGLGVAVIGGGQWLINDIVSLEVYGGLSSNKVTYTISGSGNQNGDTPVSSFGFRCGFTVGVAF